MDKTRFEYELNLSEEVQDMYNALSEDTALPLVVPTLLNALKDTEKDMEIIITGLYEVWKVKGKDGLRRIVPLVDEFLDTTKQVVMEESMKTSTPLETEIKQMMK